MEFLKLLLPAALASSFNAFANMFWKIQFTKNPFGYRTVEGFFSSLLSINIFLGMFLYSLSMVMFFYMLSNYKLSAIIPLTSLTYIFNLLLAHYYFSEKLSTLQFGGVLLIIIGIIAISQGQVSISK